MSDGQENIITLEQGWAEIEREGVEPFLALIETGDNPFFKAKEYVKLYDTVFQMCIQRDPFNWSEDMYNNYTRSILNYLVETVSPALRDACSMYNVGMLQQWKERWHKQKLIVKGLKRVFMYLDRYYTPNTDGVLSLTQQGFHLYKDTIFDVFAKHAREAIVEAISRERAAEPQDRMLLQEAVNCFVEIGFEVDKKLTIYKRELEQYIVESASKFYARQSRSWMDQDSCPNYLEKAERMINSEKARVESYLNRCTLEPLTRECYIQLLRNHQLELLDKKATGLDNLLATNATDDLTRLYRLYKKYPADLQPIAERFNEHVSAAGSAIVSRPDEKKGDGKREGNHDLVTALIDLHDRYQTIVADCFGDDQVFQFALKKAFEDFINKTDDVSKLLAKYVNEVLKKGTTINVTNLEATLNNIVFIYGYIREKDVFERNYQLFLSNRLLNDLCDSEHAEKSMIAKLKGMCGYQWTNKLEGMFKDIQNSKLLMKNFLEVYPTEEKLGLTFQVHVCSTSFWPHVKTTKKNIPKELQEACDRYTRYYLHEHTGRQLDWRLEHGRAEISVFFNKATKRTLVLNTYQMMIFLVFNHLPVVATAKQIEQHTGITLRDLGQPILSMCHPKVKVLLKNPNNAHFEEDHKFMINHKYANKLRRIMVPNIPGIYKGGGSQLAGGQDPAIQMQRRNQMDACIVRVMKTRQTYDHRSLMTEVSAFLNKRFTPTPKMIKKRIEALIQQEYLRRDPDTRSLYHYIA